MHHARPPRSAPWNLGALACVAGLGLLLAGCTLVSDRLTGVRLHGASGACIKDCNDQYKALYDDEQTLHAANLEGCLALPLEERGACLEAEGARHSAEMDRLGQDKLDCQNGCHSQGSGAAG